MARLPILDPIAQPRKRDLPPGKRDDFEGTITDPWVKYFEDLNTTVQSNPSRLTRVNLTAQGAAIAATSLPVASLNEGLYRIAYFARITTAAVTIDKPAPVSKARGLMEYICSFKGSLDEQGRIDLVVGITVPITTLGPCSKEISQVGAHNQRGEVRVQVRFKKFFWIEDLIRLVEESASCEVYALLKRQDEKYVTERAYQNPMFVEDVVREIAHKLGKDKNFTWFSVESENFESIHNHSAYAYIESRSK